MTRFKEAISGIAKFLCISLLIDLAMFLLASFLCFRGETCTSMAWSEFMFWFSMIAFIAGMPAVVASMSSSRGYFDNPLTAGADLAAAKTIVQSERRDLSKRTMYTLRMFSVGILGIATSAAIDFLTRPAP